MSSRRRFLRLGGASLALAVAGCNGDRSPTADSTPSADPSPSATPGDTPTPTGEIPESVGIQRLASGFAAPVGFEPVPGRVGEWVVVDQDGRVWLYDGDSIREEPLLDVRDRMVSLNENYDERGLLGLAFHPQFETNGRLYARYSAPRRSGTPSNYSHTFVLAEFTMEPDGSTVPLDSERPVLEIPEPQGNHNAGAVAFGPDGYCYVAVGDGGGAGDSGRGHVGDWYDEVQGGNGQDTESNLLGSILRIDVDERDGDNGYAVPEDNPLVGESGLGEHYAWGLRNPWRMSFDGEDLFVADVGQNEYEEVNLVESGGNYGWNVREATHCYDASECPDETPTGTPLADPIVEYDHGGDPPNGAAVIGGYRYRGQAIPDLRGTYVFADWILNGQLYVAEERETGLWETSVVELERDGGDVPQNALAFGRTRAGELTLCTANQSGPSGDSGAIYRIGSI
jgi:glucose/arabinose dehydrogenase